VGSGAERPFLNRFTLHDMADLVVNDLLSYCGLSPAPNIFAFLRTLDLRRWDGSPKSAWQALVDGATRTHMPECA
jgi:hypothetical protein